MDSKKPRKKPVMHRRMRNFEQKEHMFTQFAWFYYDPFRGPLKEFADKAGVTVTTLQTWRKDPLFQKIAFQQREERRKQAGAIIDKKLIKRASQGSYAHMNLFYQLCGDLIHKTEISHKPTDIPKDPVEIENEIAKLTAEVSALPKAKEKTGK